MRSGDGIETLGLRLRRHISSPGKRWDRKGLTSFCLTFFGTYDRLSLLVRRLTVPDVSDRLAALSLLGKYVEAGGHLFHVSQVTEDFDIVIVSQSGRAAATTPSSVTPIIEIMEVK